MLPLGPLGQQDLAKTWELCSRRRWYQLDKEEKGEHTHFFDYRWLSIPTSDTVIPTMHFFSMFLKLLWSTVYDMVRIDSDRHWKRCQLAANTGSYCHCPRSTKPAHRRKSWARHCRTNWHHPGLGTTGNQAPRSQKLWEQGKQSHLL